jgi:putative DNA primase/helicase
LSLYDTAEAGLALAYRLVDAGVPVLVCRPRPGAGPGDGRDVVPIRAWSDITDAEQTRADLKKFRPGVDALALIGGHGVDLVDVDTKAGGSVDPLGPFQSFGITDTPSGGWHNVVRSTGVGKISPLTVDGQLVGDYVGGTAEFESRLLGYLPGSVRPKYPGKVYTEREGHLWDVEGCVAATPDIDLLLTLLDAGGSSTAGREKFVDRGPVRSEEDGVHPYVARALEYELARLDELEHPWSPGDSWDLITFQVACNLIEFANSGWTGYTLEQAEKDLFEHAPVDDAWTESEVRVKWGSALTTVDGGGRRDPGVTDEVADDGYDEYDLSDMHLGERVARNYLRGHVLAWGRNRWAVWDGRRWDIWAPETDVLERVRLALRDVVRQEADKADKKLARVKGDGESRAAAEKRHIGRMKAIHRLKNIGTITAAMRVARGVVNSSIEEFDGPDTFPLLNCGNGVVDLRTGELRGHDPDLRFTQFTPVDFVTDATSADWDKALKALPDDVARWMQLRFGQASTGWASADDVVPFLRGGGENGKTTVLVGVKKALGDFAFPVPEKVITGNASDHPTEMFSLKGVRLAYVEELPEGDFVSSSRLKRLTGSDSGMTARPIGQDNVTWDPTHALMVTTNFIIHIGEADHGTWRRLALVEFPYTFNGEDPERPMDATLRDRIRDGENGQHEAVLAWVVAGAQRFFKDGLQRERDMPLSVAEATKSWRYGANQTIQFFDEMFEPDVIGSGAIRSSDVYAMFKSWSADKGIRTMMDQTFWKRVVEHEVFKEGLVQKVNTRPGRQWEIAKRVGMRPVGTNERMLTGVSLTETGKYFYDML